MSKKVFFTMLLLLLHLLVSPSTAEINTYCINSDTQPLIFLAKFGFTNPGRVEILTPSVSVVAPSLQANFSQLGFFLISEEYSSLIPQQNHTLCILDSPFIFPLFTFLDLPPPPLIFKRSYPITISNQYFLFFANCAPETSVTVEIQAEFYNLNHDGSRNYLSSGQTNLPSLFFLFSFSFFAFFLAFSLYLYHVSNHSLDELHFWMFLLLLTKALSLLFAALGKNKVKFTGTSDTWEIFALLFDFVRIFSLLRVVIFVGIKRNFLHPVGSMVVYLVFMLQFLALAIHDSITNDSAPYSKDWVALTQAFWVLNLISWCAIVFLIVWSARSSLREIITSKNEGEAAAVNWYKFSCIMFFYLVVMGYFIFTPYGVFALKTAIAYKYEWVSNLVQETGNLLFCIFIMFYVLVRPHKDGYSVKEQEEEIVAQDEVEL